MLVGGWLSIQEPIEELSLSLDLHCQLDRVSLYGVQLGHGGQLKGLTCL